MQRFQRRVFVEHDAEWNMFISHRFVRAKKALHPRHRFFAAQPVARAAAVVEAHLVNGLLAKVRPLGPRLPEGFADAVVGHRIQGAVEGGLVHHRHERTVREQREEFPPDVS